ncbi:hypothetical protein [Candidatus Ornithobacterium hominis]|uniref:hypothetical protein n=1 Tax=Candidatus Ornithobacterium hominis TaxID=2497989 RepID=UPI0024BCB9ED|nr:hypothetical protein [Candidatus Ornithobacterium hominis]
MEKIFSHFLSFDENSKVWIFMAENPLQEEVLELARKALNSFISQWQAHGSDLHAGFELLESRFIVICVDESKAGASGCSIDSLMRFMQGLEREIENPLTNRMLVAWKATENSEIKVEKLHQFKMMLKNGEINSDALVYDNSISDLYQFRHQWKRKLKDSWASKFL